MITIEELRNRRTPLQIELLTKIVGEFLATRNGVVATELHLSYIKNGRSKKEVVEALIGLGGSVVFEVDNHDPSSRYHPTLLGILLALDGPRYEDLLIRYLEYAWKVALEKGPSARINHVAVESALNLSKQDLALLFQLISAGHFWGSGSSFSNDGSTWEVGMVANVDDLSSYTSMRDYVHSVAIKQYDAKEPVFARDRQSQSLPSLDDFSRPSEHDFPDEPVSSSETGTVGADIRSILNSTAELVAKTDSEIETATYRLRDQVLAERADRGLLRSPSTITKFASALEVFADTRAEELLNALKKVTRARRFSRASTANVHAALNWIMDDIGRIHAAGRLQINEAIKNTAFYDGLPPSLEHHYQRLRKRLKTEIELMLCDIAADHVTRPEVVARSDSVRGSGSIVGQFRALVLRVMIASPGDVLRERLIAQEVIADWNAVHSEHRGIVLMPLLWERDTTPLQGDRPQALINAQILRKADVLVSIFWGRIGSPTGVSPSGTVEELTEHIKTGKPALLYFSEANLPHDVDPDQLKALKAFKAEAKSKGLLSTYQSHEDFRARLTRDIAKVVVEHV